MAAPGTQRLAIKARSASGGVQVLPAAIVAPDRAALVPAPTNLPADQKAFLDKYQPLSKKAFVAVSPVNKGAFSNTGSCFTKYPCFSVERRGVTTLSDKEEVTREQVSAILNHLTASPTALINQS